MLNAIKCPRCRSMMRCTNPDVNWHGRLYYCDWCGLHHMPANVHPRRLDEFIVGATDTP